MRHDDVYENALKVVELETQLVEKSRELNGLRSTVRGQSFMLEKAVQSGHIKPSVLTSVAKPNEIIARNPLHIFLKQLTREAPKAFYFDNQVSFSHALSQTGKEFCQQGALKPPAPYFMFFATGFINGQDGFAWGTYDIGSDEVTLWSEHYHAVVINLRTASFRTLDVNQQGWPEIDSGRSQDLFDKFMQLLIMLNHPFYERVQLVAPPAVNKKREKTGKRKLLNYIRVELSAEVRSSLGNDGEGRPRRPHWRRGHMRRCRSGLAVPVQPCMVNWRGETIEAKHYRIAA